MQSIRDDSVEDWIDPTQPLRPEHLGDYRIFCHFRKRPIFIQKYVGTIKLREIHKEYGTWIIQARGSAAQNPDDKRRLNLFPESFVIRICDRVFAEITSSRVIVFAESYALAVKHLNSLVSEFATKDETVTAHFHLVAVDRLTNMLETTPVKLADETLMDGADMELHYGEDFSGWHKQLVGNLTSKNSGITIFRGKPGTGKTTYLRKLIAALHKTHFFLYMPMRIGWMLNAPETIQFWIEQRRQNPNHKLVVILEDAEHFLTERGPNNASSVSDLINAGDGLLGSFLQLHLICTVNCEVNRLDKAVTRSGRMLAYREFKRLTPQQAAKLAAAKNLKIDQQESYSLAEIYNGRNELEVHVSDRKMGFAL
ncbi:MAG TPA: AAA family ATPase [Verrucomicrobiae bacterium]|nr:AAA family ATPase [Verrucomicrobiae bacterium]